MELVTRFFCLSPARACGLFQQWYFCDICTDGTCDKQTQRLPSRLRLVHVWSQHQLAQGEHNIQACCLAGAPLCAPFHLNRAELQPVWWHHSTAAQELATRVAYSSGSSLSGEGPNETTHLTYLVLAVEWLHLTGLTVTGSTTAKIKGLALHLLCSLVLASL